MSTGSVTSLCRPHCWWASCWNRCHNIDAHMLLTHKQIHPILANTLLVSLWISVWIQLCFYEHKFITLEDVGAMNKSSHLSGQKLTIMDLQGINEVVDQNQQVTKYFLKKGRGKKQSFYTLRFSFWNILHRVKKKNNVWSKLFIKVKGRPDI